MNIELINRYILDQTFEWSESDKQAFRTLYYKLFYESFGQSRKCWHNAILKTHKELLNNKSVIL